MNTDGHGLGTGTEVLREGKCSATVDADGVALAAIQGLKQKLVPN
jgi:hypothetical protein